MKMTSGFLLSTKFVLMSRLISDVPSNHNLDFPPNLPSRSFIAHLTCQSSFGHRVGGAW